MVSKRDAAEMSKVCNVGAHACSTGELHTAAVQHLKEAIESDKLNEIAVNALVTGLGFDSFTEGPPSEQIHC